MVAYHFDQDTIMPYKTVTADVLSRLDALADKAVAARMESEQASIFIESARCINVLTAANELYLQDGYVAEKIGSAKTWMASLCGRDEGNEFPPSDLHAFVIKAIFTLRNVKGFADA